MHVIIAQNGIGNCFSYAQFDNLSTYKKFLEISKTVGDRTAYDDSGWEIADFDLNQQKIIYAHSKIITIEDLLKFEENISNKNSEQAYDLWIYDFLAEYVFVDDDDIVYS